MQEFSDENRRIKESATSGGVHHGGNNLRTCDQYDIRRHEQRGFWRSRMEQLKQQTFKISTSYSGVECTSLALWINAYSIEVLSLRTDALL